MKKILLASMFLIRFTGPLLATECNDPVVTAKFLEIYKCSILGAYCNRFESMENYENMSDEQLSADFDAEYEKKREKLKFFDAFANTIIKNTKIQTRDFVKSIKIVSSMPIDHDGDYKFCSVRLGYNSQVLPLIFAGPIVQAFYVTIGRQEQLGRTDALLMELALERFGTGSTSERLAPFVQLIKVRMALMASCFLSTRTFSFKKDTDGWLDARLEDSNHFTDQSCIDRGILEGR
jgi:hypothetical protein